MKFAACAEDYHTEDVCCSSTEYRKIGSSSQSSFTSEKKSVRYSRVATAAAPARIVRERVPLRDHRGIGLYFESFRLDDGKKKLPLLMAHGLTYSSHEFDVDVGDYSLVRFLARSGYEVWLIDFAGYGRSQEIDDGFMTDSDYAVEDLADAVKVILKRGENDRLDLFGWSWGGLVAGKFAIKYPELLRKLVLYAPLISGLREKSVTAPFISNTWAHAADDFQVSLDGELDVRITDPEVVALYVANCRRFDRDTCPNGGRREIFTSPQNRLLNAESISLPTLILGGTRDPYCSVGSCREAFDLLPDNGSRLVIFDGGSHMMMIEKPFYHAFRQDVIAFLQDRKY